MKSTTRKRVLSLEARAAAVPLGWPPAHLLEAKGDFRRKVIFDLHGPILDFATPFIRFYCQLNGIEFNPELVEKFLKYYDMGFDPNNPVAGGKFAQAFRDFGRLGRGGYGDLPVRAHVKENFAALDAAGIATEIWTWVPGAAEHDNDTKRPFGTGIAQKATYDLIESLGIVKDVERQVRFINPGAKASNMVAEHIPLIIEDNPVTAVEAGYNKAHACIVTPEPYNEHLVSLPGLLRLNDHAEIAPAIISFFEKLDAAGALLGSRR